MITPKSKVGRWAGGQVGSSHFPTFPLSRFPVFILALLLSIAAVLPVPAATVTGIIRDRRGNLVSTNINFRSIARPIFSTPWIQPGWNVSTNSDSSGVFTISLVGGEYGVSLGSDARDAFLIAVPNNSSNYTLAQVITSKLTYTFPYSPSYEMLVNKDAPSGYPGLDASWGRVPSWILGTNAPGVGYALYTDGAYNYWAAAGGGGGGEANTASSIGIGVGAFKGKSGVDLQFKSFKGTNGTTITTNLNEVLVDASALTNSVPTQGQLTTASNVLNTALVANDTFTSNALRTAYLASDITTSNGAVAFTLAASNTIASAGIANTTFTSNALQTAKQDADSDLTAVAGQSGTGLLTRTGTGTATTRTITAGSTRLSVSNGDGVAANPTLDVTEANLVFGNIGSALTASNVLRAYIDLAASNRVAIAPGSNISITTNSASGIMTFTVNAVGSGSGDVTTAQLNTASNLLRTDLVANDTTTSNGVLTASRASDIVTSNALAAAKQDTDTDLTAVAGLAGTGLITRTASGTATTRTLTAGSSKLSISNGDGVASNPTLDITEANLTFGNIGSALTASNVLRAYIDLAASNRVVIAPGSNITITTNSSAGVLTYTIASTASGSASSNYVVASFGYANVTNDLTVGTLLSTGSVNFQSSLTLSGAAAPNRVLYLNAGKVVTTSSGVDATELEYLDGVTAAIQTQINTKLTNNDTRSININGNLTAAGQFFVPNDNVTFGSPSTLLVSGSLNPASTNIIFLLSEDTAPATNDVLMSEDISAPALKQVKLNNLPVSYQTRALTTVVSNGLYNFGTGAYQPNDGDLTDIAALATQPYGISLLTMGTAAAAKTSLGVPADITTTSNALRTAYLAADTVTSNGAVGFSMTASNAVQGQILTASNALRSDYIAKNTITSNGAVAFTMAASNNIATGFQPIDGDLTSISALAALGAGFRQSSGNWVIRELFGTAGEISVANGNGVAGSPTYSLPSTIDLGGKISFELPNSSNPTVDVFGEIAGDNNLWGAGRGALVWYDGTSTVALVPTLASSVPIAGQVPTWDASGYATWQTPTTAPVALTNLQSINWIVEQRLIATNSAISNIVINFAATNTVEIYATNNLTFTNWVSVADGGSSSVMMLIRPQLVNRGVNWGNLGLSNPGYTVAIATNTANPLWTTLTNGQTYSLSITRVRTNLFPILTLWL